MKSLVCLTLLALSTLCSPQLGEPLSFTTSPPPPAPPSQDPIERVNELESMLEGLNPNFIPEFIYTFHNNNSTSEFFKLIVESEGGYFFLVAKMYLYGMLEEPSEPELQQYATQAPHLAAYFYLQIAAKQYSNPHAHYWLGLLEQFKLVPDKLLETQYANKQRDQPAEALYKHLKSSHLNNGEHHLFMASALSHDPASLAIALMHK